MADEAQEKLKIMDLMLDVFGKRWATRVFLRLLYSGRRMGFNELLRATPGINPKMLAERLKSFESHGLVKREVETSPIRTYYSLTDAGLDLKDSIDSMLAWNKKWTSSIYKNRQQPKQF
ncbi:helix-turn-helix transcriptional regulator [Candidatus Micrarchaeota archaeon]|nr:helix-turn-helix transcriptional regulator [Candidatus Micrarchaeota archaeon]